MTDLQSPMSHPGDHDGDLDYYATRVKRITSRVEEEIRSLTEWNYTSIPGVREYCDYLSARIGQGEYDPTAVRKWDAWGGQREVRTLDPLAYAEEAYRKSLDRDFNRLAKYHKVQLFREYVAGLRYSRKAKKTGENREMVLHKLIRGIDKKRYNKGKTEVGYSPETGQITSVASVYIPEGERLYIVDWSRKTVPSD